MSINHEEIFMKTFARYKPYIHDNAAWKVYRFDTRGCNFKIFVRKCDGLCQVAIINPKGWVEKFDPANSFSDAIDQIKKALASC